MSDFKIMQMMADENKGIHMAPLHTNFKRANTGRDGFGEVVIAVSNVDIVNIDKYIGGLYLLDKDEYEKCKGILTNKI